MRGLLIDPDTRTISHIETADSLNDMYRLLTRAGEPKVGDINAVRLSQIDILWVDGEGFLKPDVPVFRINGYYGSLAGRSLVLGIDEGGNNQSVSVAVEELLRRDVQWTEEASTSRLGSSVERPGYFKIGDPILKPRPWPAP